jgi:voltage-gated potassium channel
VNEPTKRLLNIYEDIICVEFLGNANIQTGSQALWWSWVTITTVGYGDAYPETMSSGHIVGFFVTLAGIGSGGARRGPPA